jgi:GH35 family endo-1,4-beta-xylanase
MIVRVRRLAPRAATLLILHLIFAALTSGEEKAARWSEQAANDWYRQQAWLVGSNYVPAYAINQLEMWQAETFDPAQIDREMGWAESIGMNTMRVFLHDLLWQQDADGFSKRIDQFLQVADRHHIKPMFVLFDSCWDPKPKLGLQHPPVPGVHNSGWVQSPGAAALADPAQAARLRDYVRGVVAAFAKDSRILAGDVWNEPSNINEGSYSQREPAKKLQIVEGQLPKVFQWAREAHPSQPLTSGLWDIDFEHEAPLSRMQQIQVENSDIFSFHNYGWPESFEQEVVYLEKFH